MSVQPSSGSGRFQGIFQFPPVRRPPFFLGHRPVRRPAIVLFRFSTLKMFAGGCEPQAQPANLLEKHRFSVRIYSP